MKLLVYALFAAVVGLSIVVGFQFRSIDQSRKDSITATCISWRVFDHTLIDQVKAGEKTLPSFAYYRDHPDELALVMKNDARLIGVLVPPSYC